MKKQVNIASALAFFITIISGFPALAGFDARVAGMGTSPYTGTVGEKMRLWCTYENLSTCDSGYDGKATFFMHPFLKEPGDSFDSAGGDTKEFLPYAVKTMDFQFVPRQSGTYQMRCEIWDPSEKHKFDSMTLSFSVEEDDPCAKVSCPNYCNGNTLHTVRLCLNGQCTDGATINCDNQDSELQCSGECRNGIEYIEKCIWKDYSCVCDDCVSQNKTEENGRSCICDNDVGCLPDDPCATLDCGNPEKGSWTYYCESNTLKKKREVCDRYCDRSIRACVKDAASCDWEKATAQECNYLCRNNQCVECMPNWTCADWSVCAQGQQIRLCRDINNCQTDNDKPDEKRACLTSCQFTSASWSTDTASDNEEISLLLANNGQCRGELAKIEIWQNDWWRLLTREFNVEFNFIADSVIDKISWLAVFQKSSMLANWFDTCKGPCLKPTEYFFKVFYQGKEVVNTSKQTSLKVYPYYQDMTFEEYLREVKKTLHDQEELQKYFEYPDCLNFQGTMTERCRELFAKGNVVPYPDDVRNVEDDMIDWWNKGWNFFEPGYLIIAASSCANCKAVRDFPTGGIFLQLATAEQIFSNGLNDKAFIDPFGIFGPQACDICLDGFMEAMANPQLMAASLAGGIGKVILTAGVRYVTKKSAIESFTYTLDKTGAEITYNVGDDLYQKELAFVEDGAGRVLLRQSLYKNPMWRLDAQAAEDFLRFNARYRLVSAEYVQSMNAAQTRFTLLLAKGYELNGIQYKLNDTLTQAIQSLTKGRFGVKDVLTAVEFPETLGGNMFGRFRYGDAIKKIEIPLNAPDLFFVDSGQLIFRERVALGWTLKHEAGHAGITKFLEVYGFKPTAPPAQLSAAGEYFNDLLVIRTANPDLDVVRASLNGYYNKQGSLMLKSWITKQDPELLRLYNLAQEAGYSELVERIETDVVVKFKDAATALKQEGELFVDQIFKNGDPRFRELLLKYKLIEPGINIPPVLINTCKTGANALNKYTDGVLYLPDEVKDNREERVEAGYREIDGGNSENGEEIDPNGCFRFPLRKEDIDHYWNITTAHAPDLQSCIDYTGNPNDCTPIPCSNTTMGCSCSSQTSSSPDFALYFLFGILFFRTKRRKR